MRRELVVFLAALVALGSLTGCVEDSRRHWWWNHHENNHHEDNHHEEHPTDKGDERR